MLFRAECQQDVSRQCRQMAGCEAPSRLAVSQSVSAMRHPLAQVRHLGTGGEIAAVGDS